MSIKFKLLKKKISSKKVLIGIVGLGYVGLPLAKRFIDKGFDIIGVDSDPNKIKMLQNNRRYIKSIDIKYFSNKKNYLNTNYDVLEKADIIITCLPTPLKKNEKSPDLSYLKNCYKNI